MVQGYADLVFLPTNKIQNDAAPSFIMAPHMTLAELDFVFKLQGEKHKGPVEIHKELAAKRANQGKVAPDLTSLRLTSGAGKRPGAASAYLRKPKSARFF